MQLTNLILSTLLAQLVAAAPVVVQVTETVWVTVEAGETQALNDAYIPSPTTSVAQAAITTSDNGLLVELNTTPVDPTTQTEAATTEAATTPAYTPTTLETSTSTSETTPAAATTTTSEAAATTTSATSTTESTSSTSTAAAASTSAASDGSFQSEILNEHNAKRALHGVDALTWDNTLATYAQNYADQYDCSGTLTHSGGPYGENLALGYTTNGSVDAWYAEGDSYDYSACNVYDHFTQVVWKSTTKVGCAYKTCDSYWGTYIICSYDPAGNFVGQCSDNVLPLV